MPSETHARGHLAALADLAVRLGRATGGAAPVSDVLGATAEALGADVASLARPRGTDIPALTSGLLPTRGTGRREIRAPTPATIAATARDGCPLWLSDLPSDLGRWPAPSAGSPMASLCSVPMHRGGVLVGALVLGWTGHHDFDEAERDMLMTVAALAAAALDDTGAAEAPVWERGEHPTPPGLSISWTVAGPRTRCAVGRRGESPGLLRGSVFASMFDAAPGPAGASALDSVGGVLALARRRGTPPGLVGQEVAELAEDLPGPVTGAHVEANPDGGWVAVAPLDHDVVIASQGLGIGVATPPAAGRPAGERLVVAGDRGASVLAVTLAPGTSADRAELVRDGVERSLAGGAGSPATDLLELALTTLRVDGLDDQVRGLLAVVAAPWRPDEHGARRTRHLPASPSSVGLARRFAVGSLPASADDSTAQAVALAASELASNAVRHARDEVVVTLVDEVAGTWLGVTDDDDRPPRRPAREINGDAESGRGLALLEAFVDEIGTTPKPEGGKTVWVRLRWRRP